MADKFIADPMYFDRKLPLRTRISTVLSGVKLRNLLHSEGVDIVLQLIETEVARVEDKIDPKCIKCGTRRSVVRESSKSNHEYVQCIPMGNEEWMGFEHHSFAPTDKAWQELQKRRNKR